MAPLVPPIPRGSHASTPMSDNYSPANSRLHPGLLANLRYDLPASLVVFLVAMPLCLGIALASEAPLFSGILSGIIGGIVVGIASGSPLGVSGPAAGLVAIVLGAIKDLGSFEVFLLAVLLAGAMQIALGYLRAGIIGYYFPSSVIKGMLAGIGLIIILKQIPRAFGTDIDDAITDLVPMLEQTSAGALVITAISLGLIILWETPFIQRIKLLAYVQGPLVAVIAGIALQYLFEAQIPGLALTSKNMVAIPILAGLEDLPSQLRMPDFGQILNPGVWTVAATIAIIASLETLLCVEATDKLDPWKRVTPPERELKAQGLGNLLCGLIGGLPVTQVIVRSSANIQSGGRTKMAAILHGVLLLVTVFAIPAVLNRIPLAALAAILIMVGYKLAKPSLFRSMYALGWLQFVPFLVTVVGILMTDLLVGIGLGMAMAVFHLLLVNLRNPYFLAEERHGEHGTTYVLQLSEDVSFLNRAAILRTLDAIPANARVVIDATRSVNIDYDVYGILQDFARKANLMNMDLKIHGLCLSKRNDSVQRAQAAFRGGAKAMPGKTIPPNPVKN